MYEAESEQGPPGTFESYRAEGDLLYKNANYTKAAECYTIALDIRLGDNDCLVARSRCYLQLGDTTKALADAESSLSEDNNNHKGLYQKAEALYASGEFELALVFYHRGHKLRPELQEFRLGIQKAQEAIDNSVGAPERVTLTKEGDLTFFEQQAEVSTSYGRMPTKITSKKVIPPSAAKDKTVKELLGNLYADRLFLDCLLRETGEHPLSDRGRHVYDIIYNGIMFLEGRTDFWRQQKPMYCRRKERFQPKSKDSHKSNINEYIVRTLTDIDDAQADGRYADSLRRAEKCLKTLDNYNQDDVENKEEIIATLHSSIGNACLETGDLQRACHEHSRDLDISNHIESEDGKSRALDNLGRVYARKGEYQKAIDVWSSKLSMTKSDLESTWLYHEIGRCHLEIGNYSEALEFGEKAKDAAKSADDDMWRLNSVVLVAQSEVKLERLQEALGSFQAAMEMAKVQNDKAAESAIKKAIDDINNKIVNGIKFEGSSQKEITPEPQKEKSPEPPKKSPSPTPSPPVKEATPVEEKTPEKTPTHDPSPSPPPQGKSPSIKSPMPAPTKTPSREEDDQSLAPTPKPITATPEGKEEATSTNE
ncbi:hypothetical protein CAPTEDRAFT_148055 [Capitella teleta]|uniref:Outer dynein arm-docking complex subunit 4 n=1 Tax=Capitella teleta TaxID=283909 RepID=R7TIC9_CAPTE|nr:hypothetical protein CAPTEDRAFT_148055 [Capitella teleta]|eukprot:ELT90815.1 hypothetical protein CAPTEDRAFT_148055 [Capitella teleta]